MPHPLRMYDSSAYWFITARCFQARKLMTPRDAAVREVCGGVLARSLRKYGVQVYAYAFMSNHFHLVIGGRGLAIADFVRHLLCNLSRKLGPLCRPRWWGKFWERRASVTPILDDGALEDRVKYVLSHGVKEGLVRHARDWEGLHCAQQLVDGLSRRFSWFNWTRRWLAKHRKGFKEGAVAGRYATEWAEAVELQLTPLPAHSTWTKARRATWVRAVLEAHHAQRKQRPVLGMERVKQEASSRPKWRKLGSRPLCHASSAETWLAWVREYRAFFRHFRLAADSWLRGATDAVFPRVCFKPHVKSEVQIV